MVFCLEMGWNEDVEAVEALEGVCSMTDIIAAAASTEEKENQASGPGGRWYRR
jgi:hypothetical protein